MGKGDISMGTSSPHTHIHLMASFVKKKKKISHGLAIKTQQVYNPSYHMATPSFVT